MKLKDLINLIFIVCMIMIFSCFNNNSKKIEASGTIEDTGSEVKNFKKGDRVLLAGVFGCGTCYFCRTGRENICQNMTMLGNVSLGGQKLSITKPPG